MTIKIKTPVSEEGLNPPTPEVGKDEPTPDTIEKPIEKPAEEPVEKQKEESTPSKDVTPEPYILVDDKEFKLDDKGNALNEDGSIHLSKEELDKLEEGTQEEEVEVSMADIEAASGIELKDAQGKKIEYDFTVEGLAKREKDIKDLGVQEGANKAVTDFFNSNPDLYKAYLYKSKKGSLEGFTNEPFYTSVELDKTNEAQLTQFIIDAQVKKGDTPEEARRYAKYCKAENILEEKAESSLGFLKNIEKQEIDDITNHEQTTRKKQIEKEAAFYGTYYDESGKEVIVNNEGSIYNKVVAKGQFGNFVIPQEGLKLKQKDGTVKTLSRRDLFDYVAKPVKGTGYSQAHMDLANYLNNPDNLLYHYITNLTGGNIDQLIERKILEEKSKQIKRRLTTSKATPGQDISKSQGARKLKVPINK